MRITWLGHSAFEIVTSEDLHILIDPFITENPACTCSLDEVQADVICVTHGHNDHFGDTLKLAERDGSLVICIHELSKYLECQGIEAWGMNMGGTVEARGVKVTMVNSNHSSDMDFLEGMGPGGSSCGFILELEDGKKIYHSGDTGIFGDMKTVIRDIYSPHLAMLPIGDRFTMGPHEAKIAVEWLDVDVVIPMHYNTFPVIEQDPEKFKEYVESTTGAKVVVLEPGETYQE
ncbi:MAG TPA: metal-dependent hydrolase [Methanobacteriaceae archaeon]|nr:metal-dependent hydrolase [Methanobacteriaceae archaeon]